MRVLLCSKYGTQGASSRIRSYQYVSLMDQYGIHVTVAPLFNNLYIDMLNANRAPGFAFVFRSYLNRLARLTRARRYDLIWIEKELFPFFPAIAESFLTHLKVPYVVDYDDAIFHRYDRHRRGVVRKLLGKKIDHVMRHAALVIVGNEYLAQRARAAGARWVERLPSVVDLRRYKVALQQANGMNDTFTIGWIGSASTSAYLHAVRGPLEQICQDPSTRFVMVGARPVSLGNIPVTFIPWSEETEVEAIQSFDVGIMPLPDEPWERGKCGYKLIQYMACGKPVVASPVGINREIVEHGVNGYLAATDEDWVAALTTLRMDRQLRSEFGAAGRAKVESQYSLQVTTPRLIRLLHDAASRKGA